MGTTAPSHNQHCSVLKWNKQLYVVMYLKLHTATMATVPIGFRISLLFRSPFLFFFPEVTPFFQLSQNLAGGSGLAEIQPF